MLICLLRLLPMKVRRRFYITQAGQVVILPVRSKMLLPEDPSCKCGIAYIWALPESHPFALYGACRWHDERYVLKDISRAEADLGFLTRCMDVAREQDSTKLKVEAYFYYGICRSLGWLWW